MLSVVVSNVTAATDARHNPNDLLCLLSLGGLVLLLLVVLGCALKRMLTLYVDLMRARQDASAWRERCVTSESDTQEQCQRADALSAQLAQARQTIIRYQKEQCEHIPTRWYLRRDSDALLLYEGRTQLARLPVGDADHVLDDETSLQPGVAYQLVAWMVDAPTPTPTVSPEHDQFADRY